MLDQHSNHSGMGIKIFSVCILFALGAALAAVAELPYGGWIQIPVLSLLWWRLDQKPISFKKQFVLGLSLQNLGDTTPETIWHGMGQCRWSGHPYFAESGPKQPLAFCLATAER